MRCLPSLHIPNFHALDHRCQLTGHERRWANKGQPVVSNDGRRMDRALVHPYNSVWGMLLDADKRSKSPPK